VKKIWLNLLFIAVVILAGRQLALTEGTNSPKSAASTTVSDAGQTVPEANQPAVGVSLAAPDTNQSVPEANQPGRVLPSAPKVDQAAPKTNVADFNVPVALIHVDGNVSVKVPEVLARVRTRPGDIFNPAVVTEDTKRIAELKGVEYCYYNTKSVDGKIDLTFVVVEKNIVRKISFRGNKKYSDKKLREKLGFKVGDYLDPVLAQTYTSTIAEYYRKQGYPDVEVSLDKTQIPQGKVVYVVNEGPRVKIVAVNFSGNKNLKTGELRKTIKSSTRSWVFFSKYYKEEELNGDVISLTKAYQRKGYLNAKIEAKRQFTADRKKLRIIFVIEEGVAYKVEDYVFTGNQQFDNQKLYGQLKLLKGQTYNEQLAESDTKGIAKLYRENGFIDATVERGIKFVSDKTIAVEYTIKEGDRFRIGQITITGNEHTQDKVVRRILDEYDFQPGKWYNADIARGDSKGSLEKNIQQMVLTERDGATITPTGKIPGQKDALVNITEGKTGMVMLGAGVSSDSGVIGQLTFEQRNFNINDPPKNFGDFITGNCFRGGGQTLRISLQPGTEVSQYYVDFTEPYLNDKPVALELAGSSWARYRESYLEGRLKGFVGLDERFRNKWHHSLGFRGENVTVKDIEHDAPKEIKEVRGDNILTGIRLGAGRDLTDNRFNPKTGENYDFGYEQVTGDFTFGILSGTYRRYFTIAEDLAERKTVLATKLMAASTVGDAPPFEKFYAGGTGAYGIRGFEYRGVSTRGLQTDVSNPQREDPIGSDWIFLANAEVSVPLAGESISWLIFVDSGAIDTGGYRVGAGSGLQIMIPQWFGPVPMRFEFALPMMKSEGDETQVFSFSVGTLF
jgi:outer membrane protein insertion porin family